MKNTILAYALPFAFAFAAPQSAFADDSLVVETCKRAVAIWYMNDSPKIVEIQDFSNLKPPRARFRLDDLFGSTIRCKFKSATKPLQITEFCTLTTCMERGNERFDEVADLLKREGF